MFLITFLTILFFFVLFTLWCMLKVAKMADERIILNDKIDKNA